MYVFFLSFVADIKCTSMNSIHLGNNGPNVGFHSASLLSEAVALSRPPQ